METKDAQSQFAASGGSAPVPPQRRYTLTLKLGANSIEELCSSLRQIEFHIDVDGCRQSVSGGCGAGWHYDVAENEEMTPERYVEALHEYLAAREPNERSSAACGKETPDVR